VKKKYLTFILLFVVQIFAHAQITFQKTFGGAGNDRGNCIKQTSDGGYIIVGYSNSFAPFGAYIIKTNANGDTLWTKFYSNCYDGNLIIETGLGYTIIASPKLIYTNNLGDTIWTRSLHPGDDQFSSIFKGFCVFDTGFYAVGTIITVRDNSQDFYLNYNGQSGGTYGESGMDTAYSITSGVGGGLVIVGSTNSFGLNNEDVYLIRANPFSVMWSKTYGGPGVEKGKYVTPTVGPVGLIILADSYDSLSNLSDILIVRTDQNGDSLWSKTYGGTGDDRGYLIQQTNDKGYIIVGSTTSFGAIDTDMYVIKIDSIGNELWSKIYGGPGKDIGKYIQRTSDGGYAIIGSTNSFGAGADDIYFIKTDSMGNSGCNESYVFSVVVSPSLLKSTPTTLTGSPGTGGSPNGIIVFIGAGGSALQLCFNVGINQNDQRNLFNLYPNPSDGSFYLDFNVKNFKNASLIIYNTLGEKIFIKEINSLSTSSFSPIKLNVDPGFYLVQVISDGEESVKKLIIE
jgi:hypothetical protein